LCAVYVEGATSAVDGRDADEGFPRVTLSEMLDDLHIADDEAAALMME